MTAMRTMGLAPVLPPEASVEQSANEYVVHLAVPGFAQEELEVEIAGRFVTVRGDQTQTTIGDCPFRLHERLEEHFQLPADVDTHGVTAAYTHGALELRAPRTNGARKTPRKVPIDSRRTAVNPDASGV
ncbi:MAG TPA: Hsp20/alpha crystallin family protein [Gaiellaceae bacterium]|jgi:HSP20 family protein